MTHKSPAELHAIVTPFANAIIPSSIWQHKDTGGRYIALVVCLNEADFVPTVVYAPTDHVQLGYSMTWARPAEEFLERFRQIQDAV